MRSGSTWAQNKAVAPEARRERTEMSEGMMLTARPMAAAAWRSVEVRCEVVTASHRLVK
jgi:hypothetical protein